MRKNRLIIMLSVLCALSLLLMAAALGRDGGAAFAPPPFEPAAWTGTPPEPSGAAYQMLEAGPFSVGLCGEIRIRDGGAEACFHNPESNCVWLRLRILGADGEVLGQTGLLRPGEYVRAVAMADRAPGTPVTLKVMAYEPDTYHSAGALTLHMHIAE